MNLARQKEKIEGKDRWHEDLIGSCSTNISFPPLFFCMVRPRTDHLRIKNIWSCSELQKFNRNQIICTFDLTISRVLFVSLGQCCGVESLVEVDVYEVGRPMVKPKVKSWVGENTVEPCILEHGDYLLGLAVADLISQ